MEYDYVFASDEEVDFEQDEEHLQHSQGSDSEELPQNEHELPITQHKQEIMDMIEKHQVVILCGTTGSGKTTQIPQYLTKFGSVACTQPRRLAAIAVAARVAEEMHTNVGDQVGYSVRFDTRANEDTQIKFVTDGILMREFLGDRDLVQYSAIMIDEAHERTLHTDINLTLLKEVCRRRPELRLVISSATLDTSKFQKFFDGAPVFNVPGRIYPVDIYYTKQPESNYIQAALMTIFQIHLSPKSERGDVLVFLPGQEEIESMAENLIDARNRLGSSIKELIVAPVYANMAPHHQQKIFEPTPENARKVILATNIAETSLTIDGIVYVIDPGLVKQKLFNARSGMDSLSVQECSRASANQRTGRAGRVQAGICYRLYPKQAFNELQPETLPEVLRTNLATVVLLLMSIGVKNVLEFDFIDKPEPDALVQALQVLYSLGAINAECALTKTGRRMVELPVEPVMAKTILEAQKLGCLEATIVIIAMLGEMGALFYRPKKRKQEADECHRSLAQPGGDHFTLLHLFKVWKQSNFSRTWCSDRYIQYKAMLRARNVQKQLRRVCSRFWGSHEQMSEDAGLIQQAFLSGFIGNVAKLSRNGEFYTTLSTNIPVYIHPSSFIFGIETPPNIVLYNEILVTSKEYMRGCLVVDEEQLNDNKLRTKKAK